MFGLLALCLPRNRSQQTFWLWIALTQWPAPTCVNIPQHWNESRNDILSFSYLPWFVNLEPKYLSTGSFQNCFQKVLPKLNFSISYYTVKSLCSFEVTLLWVMLVYSAATGRGNLYHTLFDMITEDTIKMEIQYIIENDLFFKGWFFSWSSGQAGAAVPTVAGWEYGKACLLRVWHTTEKIWSWLNVWEKKKRGQPLMSPFLPSVRCRVRKKHCCAAVKDCIRGLVRTALNSPAQYPAWFNKMFGEVS